MNFPRLSYRDAVRTPIFHHRVPFVYLSPAGNSGPDVVKTVTQEEVTQEVLGGATSHTTLSGVAHASFQNDLEALRATRELLAFLPQSNKGE